MPFCHYAFRCGSVVFNLRSTSVPASIHPLQHNWENKKQVVNTQGCEQCVLLVFHEHDLIWHTTFFFTSSLASWIVVFFKAVQILWMSHLKPLNKMIPFGSLSNTATYHNPTMAQCLQVSQTRCVSSTLLLVCTYTSLTVHYHQLTSLWHKMQCEDCFKQLSTQHQIFWKTWHLNNADLGD